MGFRGRNRKYSPLWKSDMDHSSPRHIHRLLPTPYSLLKSSPHNTAMPFRHPLHLGTLRRRLVSFMYTSRDLATKPAYYIIIDLLKLEPSPTPVVHLCSVPLGDPTNQRFVSYLLVTDFYRFTSTLDTRLGATLSVDSRVVIPLNSDFSTFSTSSRLTILSSKTPRPTNRLHT